MATALELCNRALKTLGVTQSGEVLEASEAVDILELLQDMLESWSNDHFTIHVVTTDVHPLTQGQSVYTYGPGGDIDAARPQSVLGGYIRGNGTVDYPLKMIWRERYDIITTKNVPSRPSRVYFLPEYPLAKLLFDRAPDAAYTAHIDALKPLDIPDGLSAEASFPPGYTRAIRYNLAVEAALSFGVAVNPVVAAIADDSLRSLKRQNLRIPRLATELSVRGRYDIRSDY